MKLGKLLENSAKAKTTVSRLGFGNILLIICVFILSVMAFGNRERIVFVPPFWNQKMELGVAEADAALYQSWGSYFAGLIGNVTPENVQGAVEFISRFLGPEIRSEWEGNLRAQAIELSKSGHSIFFTQRRVEYEAETGKVFVAGSQNLVGASGGKRTKMLVYEFQLDVRSGLPVVRHIDVYEGAAKTQQWLKNNRDKIAAESTGQTKETSR